MGGGVDEWSTEQEWEVDEDLETMQLPETINMPVEEIPIEEISWPPRPNIAGFGDIYDQVKEFILNKSQFELVFPPMEGNARKMVHMVAELFGLPSKSFGTKQRHVRVYKSVSDVPKSIHVQEGGTRPAKVRDGVPELKIPLYIKESKEAIREIVLETDATGAQLIKRVLKEGKPESLPSFGDQVEVHYEGYYLDGGVFDSSRFRKEEFKFELGKGHVISAWDISIATMNEGEIIELIVPPMFGFGKWGCPPRIPQNATLKYEIEFLRSSVAVLKQQIKMQSVEESIEYAKNARYEGNTHFRNNAPKKASKCYNRGLNCFSTLRNLSEEDEAKINESKVLLHTNLALCFLKLKDYKRAKASCAAALDIDPNNAKALCRMGETLIQLKDIAGAKDHLVRVYQITRTDPKVNELLRLVKEKELEANVREKEMFKGIFTS